MFDIDTRDGVATVTLKHGKANALDLEFCTALAREFTALDRDDVRALVVTAEGSIFSAGVDLVRLLDEPLSYTEAFLDAMQEMYEALCFFPQPVVVAVNGHAIAGGCVMALAADRALAAAGTARIGLAELAVGVPIPALVVEIARAALPPQAFAEVVLSARSFTVEESRERGIVHEVVAPDALAARAREVATTWSAWRRDAIDLTKMQMRAPIRERVESPGRGYDAEVRARWKSDATRAAIRAYIEATFKKPR